MVRRFPILFRSCMCLPPVTGEMAGSSWVVSQKPSHLLPSTLLTSPNPPKPPDPPDPPPRRRCLEALVTTSPSHSPHPILEAALAGFSLDKGHICTLFNLMSEGLVSITLLCVVHWYRNDPLLVPFYLFMRQSLAIVGYGFGVNLFLSGYLSDHFYGDFDFPCFKDGVRLVLTFFVAKDGGKFEPQFSVNQRREQLRNDGLDNDEGHVYFETYDGDMQDSQVPETQENEEVYRVNIDDETRQSNAFIRESLHQNSSPAAPFQIPTSRIQQRGGVRRGSSSQRGAGNSQISTRSGSRGSRRKQSFETTLTDTITGFREFQRQSLQQLRPNFFDEADYNEFDMAVKIFESMALPNDTDFYWACMHAFKEERFWPSGQNFGSPIGSGFSFGSPSFGGNYSLGQSSGSQWGPGIQQWGTPPTAPQWNSPSNVPQWGMPPTAPQWGPPPNMPQWSSPPTAPQWNSPSNAPQWGTPPTAPQWNSPSNAPQWGTQQNVLQWSSPPNVPQWRSSPNAPQWGSSQNAPQYIPPTNVQRGFSLGTEEETTTNAHQRVSHEEDVPSAENMVRGVSPEFGFTNYSSTPRTSRPRRRGGLFNIWGSGGGLNLNETHQSDSASEN
ncbi:hypothetical protein ISN45_Aa07g032980 [Arabidopsis thaliana x Arabidopsis arenosa]|uniref:Uncharacterized protein n=1 Tax=Arabidopsis thaliana x Arabidopsis arenosa TaxID=1240361 RepID=A0A8T1YCK0_9BRAS|nr:hypothetical protein ISN45_Aa07g032980 [Arabidopsis thaliana x Arabidopsis arenosa]